MNTQVFVILSIVYGLRINFLIVSFSIFFLLAAVPNIMNSVFPRFEFRMKLLLRSHVCKRFASFLIALFISTCDLLDRSQCQKNRKTVPVKVLKMDLESLDIAESNFTWGLLKCFLFFQNGGLNVKWRIFWQKLVHKVGFLVSFKSIL